MHCGIAGMSVGVPTLLLAYSPKAIGMCEYVYGSRDFVLGMDAGPDEWSLRLSELLNPDCGIRSYLLERMKEVRADALKAGEHITGLLS